MLNKAVSSSGAVAKKTGSADAVKKTAVRKTAVKKTTSVKTAAVKKTAVKKSSPGKSGTQAVTRTPARKAPTKKVVTKRVAANKVAAKKVVAKKVVTKPTVKKIPAQPVAKTIVKPPVQTVSVAKGKFKKPKLVRDSFTMPESEYQILADVKKAFLKSGIAVKKSELLRAGVALLNTMSQDRLRAVIAGLPPLKAGRPKKK